MNVFRNKYSSKDDEQVSIQNTAPEKAEVRRLVERAIERDFEAFGELYTIYLNRIYRYVYYQVKDKMSAEDICEEVFIKAWKAIRSCRGKEDTFLPWLYSIAHNRVIDIFRNKKGEISAEVETVSRTGNTHLEVEREIEKEKLLEVIATLNPNQRQVIILKFIEGFSNAEIGKIMKKNQGAIRITQMRALTTLRQILGNSRNEIEI